MGKFKVEHSSVVLGLGTCGLGIVRSLGVSGIAVDGFDYERTGQSGFYSKYVKASICPHPVYQPKELIRFLTDFSRGKSKKPVLFFSADQFAKFVSDYKKELEPHFLFSISPEKLINNIIDKQAQYELVKTLHFNIPTTHYPQSLDELYFIKNQLQYPLIIKGRYSFAWREKFGGSFKGFVISDFDKLTGVCKTLFDERVPFLLQKIIEGPAHNIFQTYVYRNISKNICAHFNIMKIRQSPPHFGNGSSIESVARKDFYEESLRFFNAINFKGLGAVEFKLEQKTKKFTFIELNPRLAMQNFLSTVCGVNLSLIQYLDLTGQKIEIHGNYKTGVRWISAIVDFKSFFQQNKLGVKALLKWLKFLSSCRVFSVFLPNDPRPFFLGICQCLSIRKVVGFIRNTGKNRNGERK